MNFTITKFVTGPLETNSYVVSLNREPVLVVDPSSGCGVLLDHLKSRNQSIQAILLTHGHFDHILGISEIRAVSPAAEVWVHPDETLLLRNPQFNGSFMIGAEFVFRGAIRDLIEGPHFIGAFSFEVLHLPGHSPGGVALVFRDSGETKCISGDSLFAGSIGRSDFPGSDGVLLLRGIREKLLALPDDTVVYPGHGGRTTIGRERRLNPYLQSGF